MVILLNSMDFGVPGLVMWTSCVHQTPTEYPNHWSEHISKQTTSKSNMHQDLQARGW